MHNSVHFQTKYFLLYVTAPAEAFGTFFNFGYPPDGNDIPDRYLKVLRRKVVSHRNVA